MAAGRSRQADESVVQISYFLPSSGAAAQPAKIVEEGLNFA
jgi:hypothetical protein